MAGPRLPLPADAPLADGAPDVYAAYADHVGPGRHVVSRLTRRSRWLDPVTREVVRLRNAHLQGCVF